MSLSPSRRFHVVSLQVPFPPDYGGVIDIYYKLKALKKMGYETWLHTFQYDRSRAEQLNEVAARVSYYPRHRSVIRQLSHIPYIVSSRHCSKLLDDLLSDNAPILFEGLHCCAFLSDKRLKDRIKLVRTHNIEHEYYKELSRKTSGWKKLYYELEAVKLAKYEKILLHADAILAISESDRCYFSSRYPQIPVSLLPAFHAYAEVAPAGPKENYILYHGNLSVEENIEAAEYLLRQVAHTRHIMDIRRKKSPGNTRSAGRTDTRRTTHRQPLGRTNEPAYRKSGSQPARHIPTHGIKTETIECPLSRRTLYRKQQNAIRHRLGQSLPHCRYASGYGSRCRNRLKRTFRPSQTHRTNTAAESVR
mgnify:CR=1 FL=1